VHLRRDHQNSDRSLDEILSSMQGPVERSDEGTRGEKWKTGREHLSQPRTGIQTMRCCEVAADSSKAGGRVSNNGISRCPMRRRI
jgi:hypothetical protein